MFSRRTGSSTTMASSGPTESQRRHTQQLMDFNQEMFKRNVLTDVECVIEGQVFQAHRALLVCFSPYLKRKLLNEDGKPIAKKVCIPRIGTGEFEVLLRYMYSGSIEVDCNDFFEVWKAASLLEMQNAKDECLQLIDGSDEIRTYFYTYILSKKLGIEPNWQKALKLITHRFEETVFTKEFMKLDLPYVLEILSAQSIGARSETIVFLAALNWLDKDYERRAMQAVIVMMRVRFSCMSMEEIVACFHPPFLYHVVQIPEVQMMLFKATCYIAAKSQGVERLFKQYANPKRNLILEKLPMKLWHKQASRSEDAQMDSQSVDSSTSSKYAESGLPDSLKGHLETMLDSEDPEKHLEQFLDAKFRTRDTRYPGEEDSNVPVRRKDHLFRDRTDDLKDNELDMKSANLHREEQTIPKSVYFGDKSIENSKVSNSIIFSDSSIKDSGCILVIGGMNPHDFRKDSGGEVLIFNVETNKWLPYTNLPEPRHNHSSACIENTLYVVGGCNSKETIEQNHYLPKKSCYKLNTEKTNWSMMPDMKCARFDHAMVVYKGRLIVIGGQDEKGRMLKSVEMYDPKEEHWSLSTNMCCGRKAMGAAVFADRIWIAGGVIPSSRNQVEVVTHVDLFHPDKEKWNFNSYLLPSARSHCCLVEWDGKLYCIGGMMQTDKGKVRPTDQVWFVNGENQIWELGPCLPQPRMGGIAVIYEKNLYYVGGYDPENGSNIQNIIYLTPGANSWSVGPPMISGMFGLSAVSFRFTEEKYG